MGVVNSEHYPNCYELYVKSESFEDTQEPRLIKPFVYTVTESNG